MRRIFIITLALAACNADPLPATFTEPVEVENIPDKAAVLEEQRRQASRRRAEEIRIEQERIDSIRRANEVAALEAAIQFEEMLRDPNFIPFCESETYAEIMRREGLRHRQDSRFCEPVKGDGSFRLCPPCR